MKRLIFALERFTGSEGVFDSMKAINLFPVVRGSEGESKSQLPVTSLWKPQVNVRAANNYSHKSHAIKFKKTAKTNEFLHRIHALKNKAKDIFCVAD